MISEEERHAIEHARYMIACSDDEHPEICFDYELVRDLVNVVDRLTSLKIAKAFEREGEQEMTDWQDISTAPEDHMILTIWDGINNKTGHAVRYWHVAYFDGQDWIEHEFNDVIDTPTHWMPLPDPPIG